MAVGNRSSRRLGLALGLAIGDGSEIACRVQKQASMVVKWVKKWGGSPGVGFVQKMLNGPKFLGESKLRENVDGYRCGY